MGERTDMTKVIAGILRNRYEASGGILSEKDFTELGTSIWNTVKYFLVKSYDKMSGS